MELGKDLETELRDMLGRERIRVEGRPIERHDISHEPFSGLKRTLNESGGAEHAPPLLFFCFGWDLALA